ncbi:MAG: hypothetical protein KME23_00500 [Goleter apudmare HA4340-LM2]|jgi:hypothetical protein|nr:hypothetical protein [Goleter apudmare HA4340-LM2]
MTLQIDIHLPEGIWQRFQQAKYFVDTSINSAQQATQSFKETAINTVTTTWEQAKGSVGEGWQTAEQIQSTTSGAVQTAITSYMNEWLAQHPLFFRLFQIFGWATNHPIISFIILLFIVALIWSLIKAIMRLIETASWSIIQVPLKLLLALIKVSYLYFSKLSSLAVEKIRGSQATENMTVLISENSSPVDQNKQQRLAEISRRLEAIQKEQNQLLEEAANLIAVDTVDFKIKEIKSLSREI